MANFFAQHCGALNLVKQVATPNKGFRLGQLGAMHAVLAHESVHDDPAIVCLPTGYGKTSLMMALPLLLAAKRVLVVEPSDALRRQVSSHFRELSTLRRIGAIGDDVPNPEVHKLEGRPQDAAAWEALSTQDVVVTTAASASPALAPGACEDLFDLIIFDEAHHAPADTWAAFLTYFKKARFVFLTATPFRRDGRVIPGKLVYRYRLCQARWRREGVLASQRLAKRWFSRIDCSWTASCHCQEEFDCRRSALTGREAQAALPAPCRPTGFLQGLLDAGTKKVKTPAAGSSIPSQRRPTIPPCPRHRKPGRWQPYCSCPICRSRTSRRAAPFSAPWATASILSSATTARCAW